MTKCKAVQAIGRRTLYLYQKITGSGIDSNFEQDLHQKANEYLKTLERGETKLKSVEVRKFTDLLIKDESRYTVFRDDIYKRFIARKDGPETDKFGRAGEWVPRGCVIYYEKVEDNYVKVFDEYFCRQGEGRYLKDALERGLYDFLCPDLSFVIEDEEGLLRGYAIRAGKPLSKYQFNRYIGGAMQNLICALTKHSGLYFYDLAFHNFVLNEGSVSIIDLESVLPNEWFGKGPEFSLRHLPDIDIGWSIQTKWCSPDWYRRFLMDLTGQGSL